MESRVKDFGAAHKGILPPTFLAAVREAVVSNTAWLDQQGADVCWWLQQNQ